ncbi:hypothetical protein IFVP203_C1220270 [Vibrio parahaemolyticus]
MESLRVINIYLEPENIMQLWLHFHWVLTFRLRGCAVSAQIILINLSGA